MSAACGVDRTSLRRSVFECFGLHRNTFFRFGPQCKLFGMRMVVTAEKRAATFYGWRVVQAAFVLAIFGWGLGFYGPPVFLSFIRESRGWSVVLISAAVSLHFLAGSITGANLPALHRRCGVPAITKAGALAMAAGLATWSLASSPGHLFVAASLSGTGWGTMSAAALNAIVSPWVTCGRPAA